MPIIWKSRRRTGRRPPKIKRRWPTIPTTSGSGSGGSLLFHVVVDDFARSYSLDGPDANAMRLHFEVRQAARHYSRKLREIQLRADSREQALASMQEHFADYACSGSWKT